MGAQYIPTIEVAQKACTSPSTVRYWRHIGYGPAGFRVGRRVLYDADEVDAWLEGLKRGEQSQEKVS